MGRCFQPLDRADRSQRSRPTRPGHPDRALAGRLRSRADRITFPVRHRDNARPITFDAHEGQFLGREENGDRASRPDIEPVPVRLPRDGWLFPLRTRGSFQRAPRGVVGLRLGHQYPARARAFSEALVPPAGDEASDNGDGRGTDGALAARGAGARVCLPADKGDGRRHAR